MVNGQGGAPIGRVRIAANAIGKARQTQSRPARLVELGGAAPAGSDGGNAIRVEDGARMVHAR